MTMFKLYKLKVKRWTHGYYKNIFHNNHVNMGLIQFRKIQEKKTAYIYFVI